MPSAPPRSEPRLQENAPLVGHYTLHEKIASGGMASVHFARLVGPLGFTRVVAVKRLHPQFAKDPEFIRMFLDEARLVARVRHPNVVPTIDVVATGGEVLLVMEYVQGESLGKLLTIASQRDEPIPAKIAITILIQGLWGLHAAHEAKTPRGAPLGVIHRDVSPQNILVGDDGVARIVDFGVAKAAWRPQQTLDGQLKGKIAYMPPEQLCSEPNQDRRVDVYAASVCLWEALTGRRYVENDTPAVQMRKVLTHVPEPPSKYARGLPRSIDTIVLRGLARSPADRFATALDMATALEQTHVMASAREVGDWVRRSVGEVLEGRARVVFEIERGSTVTQVGEIGASNLSEIPSSASYFTGSTTLDVRIDAPGTPRATEPAMFAPKSGNASALVVDTPPRQVPTSRTPIGRGLWGWMSAAMAVAVASIILFAHRPPVAAPAPDRDPVRSTTSVASVPPYPDASTVSFEAPTAPTAPTIPVEALPVELKVPTASSSPRPYHRNCHPPYIIDSEGVRIPKRECLHL